MHFKASVDNIYYHLKGRVKIFQVVCHCCLAHSEGRESMAVCAKIVNNRVNEPDLDADLLILYI